MSKMCDGIQEQNLVTFNYCKNNGAVSIRISVLIVKYAPSVPVLFEV